MTSISSNRVSKRFPLHNLGRLDHIVVVDLRTIIGQKLARMNLYQLRVGC